MSIEGFNTRVAEEQLNMLFDIRAIFNRRGREVAGYENRNELLFDASPEDALEKYYKVFHSSSFRRVVSTVANARRGLTIKEIMGECSGLNVDQIKAKLDESLELKLLKLENDKYFPFKGIGFGSTFEWYVASVCIRELSSIAYWGVRVKGLTGDYDVVLIRENKIGYIECKSGKFSHINENHIKQFLDRERILAPQFSIYLVDGISTENLSKLVDYALAQKCEYEFETPGVMDTGVSLEPEVYKNFIRLIPINSFFISISNSLSAALRELYKFLTLVCDRTLPTENKAAKKQFVNKQGSK